MDKKTKLALSLLLYSLGKANKLDMINKRKEKAKKNKQKRTSDG